MYTCGSFQTELTNTIKEKAKQLAPRLLEIRRDFHMYPELSKVEFKTTAKINQILDEYSVPRLDLTTRTGTAAMLQGKQDGPVLAIRADIDALPIQEESNLAFASRVKGISHMCGHDVHTTITLGAAIVLKHLQEEFPNRQLPGTIKFLFQPAEEVDGGAESMIDEGLFQHPKVDAIIGLHNNPLLPVGKIGIKEGFLMASIDDFTITIHGKGGHAGIPEHTIDPVVIGSAVVGLLQTIASRVVSPKESAVVTIGKFNAGTANNVIPDTAILEGTVRASSEHVRQTIAEILPKLVNQIVLGMGGQVDIDYRKLIPPVVNDETLTSVLQKASEQIVGAANTVRAETTMGGDDFAMYQQIVPGCYYWLGTGNVEKDMIYDWHHPKFKIDEQAIEIGVMMMVQAAMNFVQNGYGR